MASLSDNELTHWGLVIHKCVGEVSQQCSGNGLVPAHFPSHYNADLLSIEFSKTNFSERFVKISKFSLKKWIWRCYYFLQKFIHFVDTSVNVVTACTCISNRRLQCASDEQEFPDWVWDVTWLRDERVCPTKLDFDSVDFYGVTCTCSHFVSRFITDQNGISPQIENFIFSTYYFEKN